MGVSGGWHRTVEVVVIERGRLIECSLRAATRHFEVVKASTHGKERMRVHGKQSARHGFADGLSAVIECVCRSKRDVDRWGCQSMRAEHSGD